MKAHALKACLLERVTWVRIPLSPPVFQIAAKHAGSVSWLLFLSGSERALIQERVRAGLRNAPTRLTGNSTTPSDRAIRLTAYSQARLGTLIREFCSTPRIGNLRQGKADGFRRTRREQSWNALLQGSASIPRCGPVDQCVCVLPINICFRAGEDAVL